MAAESQNMEGTDHMVRYAAFSGAWYLDRRCRLLSPSEAEELDRLAEAHEQALVSAGTNQPTLFEVRRSARITAEEEGCGPATGELLRGILRLGPPAGAVQEEWGSLETFRAVRRERVLSLLVASGMSEHCGILNPARRERLSLLLDEAWRDAARSPTPPSAEALKAEASSLTARAFADGCGDAALAVATWERKGAPPFAE
jgi:hypothetical protein